MSKKQKILFISMIVALFFLVLGMNSYLTKYAATNHGDLANIRATYWASITGSFIAGILTLFGVILTILHYKRSDYEQNRLQHMPYERKFLASLDSKWNRGFVASELVYYKALQCIEEFRDNIDNLAEEEKAGFEYVYQAMIFIFSRASQQYLEVVTLVEGGLADGALARWRSLYELSIVSSFIIKHGEKVAKAFINAAYSTDKYKWAKASDTLEGKKSVRFSDIEKNCDIDTTLWNDEYKQATAVTHPSAQATFQRISSMDVSNYIPAGRSDYGIAYPAVLASKTYIQIVVMFLNIYPTSTHIAMAKVFVELMYFVEKEYEWCYEHIDWDGEHPIINGTTVK